MPIVHLWEGIAVKAALIALTATSATLAIAILFPACDPEHPPDFFALGAGTLCVLSSLAALYVSLLWPIEVLQDNDYLVVRFLVRVKAIHYTAIQRTSRHLLTVPVTIQRAHLLLIVKTPRLAMGRFVFSQEGTIVDADWRRKVDPSNYRTAFDGFLDHARSLPVDTILAGRPYRTQAGPSVHP